MRVETLLIVLLRHDSTTFMHATPQLAHAYREIMALSLPLTSVVIGRFRAGAQTVLVFGRPRKVAQQGKDRRRLTFAPGSILCCLTFRSKAPGVGLERLDILRAVAPGERCSRIAGVTPGAEVLVRARRIADINQVRRLIAAVRADGCDPSDVSASFWVVVQNRLRARETLPAFSVLAQAAAMRRRDLGL